MKTLYIHINNCYGGFCSALEREYKSPEEFKKALDELKRLTPEQIKKDYNDFDPLECSRPILLRIELDESELYRIDEYDGMESLYFEKKGNTISRADLVTF